MGKSKDRFDHRELELAKWVAIATMAVDHYGKIVEPDLYEPTHMIGRVSFPLFAAIIGYRLAFTPRLAGTYLNRLVSWAIVSQPVYVIAGRERHEGEYPLLPCVGCGTRTGHRTAESGPEVVRRLFIGCRDEGCGDASMGSTAEAPVARSPARRRKRSR